MYRRHRPQAAIKRAGIKKKRYEFVMNDTDFFGLMMKLLAISELVVII